MVTVFFPGGDRRVEIDEAVRAQWESIPAAATTITALKCYDAKGKLVAVFKQADIAGYTVTPES